MRLAIEYTIGFLDKPEHHSRIDISKAIYIQNHEAEGFGGV